MLGEVVLYSGARPLSQLPGEEGCGGGYEGRDPLGSSMQLTLFLLEMAESMGQGPEGGG